MSSINILWSNDNFGIKKPFRICMVMCCNVMGYSKTKQMAAHSCGCFNGLWISTFWGIFKSFPITNQNIQCSSVESLLKLVWVTILSNSSALSFSFFYEFCHRWRLLTYGLFQITHFIQYYVLHSNKWWDIQFNNSKLVKKLWIPLAESFSKTITSLLCYC